MKKKLLLIITGSVAAYKSVDLIRLFKKANYQISPIMTKGAKEFVTPLLVSSIAGTKVLDELFSAENESKIGHIDLSRQNDVIIIAPASADFIAKMARGLADDLASSVVLASNKPIFIAPAMNEKMWLNSQTQKNLQILRENGVKILEPVVDILACGEYGMGKMLDPEKIFLEINDFFTTKKSFIGKKIIITAGASYEAIDPVRFIGNYSSGKQGISIAEEFSNLGAKVLLIAANINENINLPKENIIRVKTGKEILEATENNLSQTDIFISTAAIADFIPRETANEKIKKSENQKTINLELIENIDVLKTIANHQNRPKTVIGFAAESQNLIKNAKNKLKTKNCDLLLANNIKNGGVFGSNYNEITVIDKNGNCQNWGKITKREAARKLTKLVLAA